MNHNILLINNTQQLKPNGLTLDKKTVHDKLFNS